MLIWLMLIVRICMLDHAIAYVNWSDWMKKFFVWKLWWCWCRGKHVALWWVVIEEFHWLSHSCYSMQSCLAVGGFINILATSRQTTYFLLWKYIFQISRLHCLWPMGKPNMISLFLCFTRFSTLFVKVPALFSLIQKYVMKVKVEKLRRLPKCVMWIFG